MEETQEIKDLNLSIRLICRIMGQEQQSLIFNYIDDKIGLHFNALTNTCAIYDTLTDEMVYMDSPLTNEFYSNIPNDLFDHHINLWEKCKKIIECETNDNKRINSNI